MISGPRKPDAIPRLDAYRNSERLSAAKMNRGVDALNRMTQGTRPVRQIVPPPRGGKAKKAIRLRFQSMGPDHLVCLDDSGNEVLVARQWLIRRTPFDGQTRDGISYEYSADNRRVASVGVEPDEETETQEIIQKFVVDDEVWAEEPETTGVVVTIDGDPEADPPIPDRSVVVKLLMQSDGRAFAKVPE